MSQEPQDGPAAESRGAPPALSISNRSPALTVLRTIATTPIEAAGPTDPREPALSSRLLHLWNIVVKWRWPIMGMATLGLCAGVIATLMTVPIYRATTTIQIDAEPAKVQAVAGQQAIWEDPEKYYLTQYELLRSRTLAERVAQNEDLGDDETLLNPPETKSVISKILHRKTRPPSRAGHAARTALAAGMVAGGLTVDPVRASRLVRISFDSPDPAVAARIANAAAANFISWNLERRYEASAQARKFLEDRLAQTRQTLEDSQRRGNAFAQQNRLITVGGAAPMPTGAGVTASSSAPAQTGELIDAADLSSLDTSLSAATAARIQAQQHWSQTQSTADSQLPEVIADVSYQTLRAQRDAANADYQQNLRLYRPNYPTMIDAKAKIDALNQQIAAIATSIRGGLKSQYETALKNEFSAERRGRAAERPPAGVAIKACRRRFHQYRHQHQSIAL